MKTLTNRFKIYVISIIILTTTILLTTVFVHTDKVLDGIGQDYAMLYTKEIAHNIESFLNENKVLVDQMNALESLKMYISNPSDENKIRLDKEVGLLKNIQNGNDLFFADEKSKNMYFWRDNNFEFVGHLDYKLPQDKWFFKTLESDKPVNLNVDRDRFIDKMNVWINYQVFEDETLVGVNGIGLDLSQFLKAIKVVDETQQSRTLIINQFGAVQVSLDQKNIQENSFSEDVPIEKSLFAVYDDDVYRKDIVRYLNDPESSIFYIGHPQYDFVAIEPIEQSNWHVLTYYEATQLVDYSSVFPVFGVILFVVLCLSILVIRRFNRLLGVPFDQLIMSLNQDWVGDKVQIHGAHRNDEFGEIARSVERLSKKIIQNIPVGVFHITYSLEVTYANTTFLKSFLIDNLDTFNQAIIERPHLVFASKEMKPWLHGLLEEQKDDYRFEAEFLKSNRDKFWAEVRLVRKEGFYEGILINIQEQKNYVESLVEMAKTDALTGLFNRRALNEILQNAIEGEPERLTLILFDLDHFKKVNDTYGHDVGDMVLLETVKSVYSCIPVDAIFTRWGGEEFLIVLSNYDLEDGHVLAEMIRRTIEEHSFKVVGKVTASFGVAPYLKGDTVEALFARADKVMLSSKMNGRNRVSIFETATAPLIHLPWQSKYECGDSTIDFEHQLLFEMANIGFTEEKQLMSPEMKIQELEHILTLIKTHFKNEEVTLENYHYPSSLLNEHATIHKKLLDKMYEKLEQVKKDSVQWVDFYMFLIQEVIFKHMIEEDKQYYDFIKNSR